MASDITTLDELAIEGKRVFIRVDMNVPLDGTTISDDTRIRAALPTIKYAVKAGARVILASHLGRPKGKPVAELSLEPVAVRLAELLDLEVMLTDEPVGDGARKVVGDLREGQITVLENLRFDPGETANDEHFARALASLADVYVNDAFGTAHRAHASTYGMVSMVPERAAGFVMAREIDALGQLLGNVDRPYTAVVGGAKVSDKIAVLEALAGRCNTILIGGAMANTFLAAGGRDLGKSRIETDCFAIARTFLRNAGNKVVLPTDARVGTSLKGDSATVRAIGAIGDDEMILDIGPATVERYVATLGTSRTVFWNGPMGVFENPAFAEGTMSLARALGANEMAYSVVGGGDSVYAIHSAGVADKVSHVSTGGGASLEFVQGLELPGIVALRA